MDAGRPGTEVYLSVVAPAYNEAENLQAFVDEVGATLGDFGHEWELVIVDDGSTDDSTGVLQELMKERKWLRVLVLDTRHGRTPALEAGFRASRGQYIAMIDADLQNDPKDITGMLELLEQDRCDLVNGWRKQRLDNRVRLLSTRIANAVRNRLTQENIRDSASGLKVFRRSCLERIKLYRGMHRFLATLFKIEGFRVMEVEMNHRPRRAGKGKYGVWNRVFRALRDAFAVRWMRKRAIRYEARELERDDV